MKKKLVQFFQNYAFHYLVLILYVLLIYFPSLNNNYGFNDNYIFNKTTEKGLQATGDIFTSAYRNVENINYGYRPITSLSVAAEISLFGKNPYVSHFINLFLYILIVCLLYYLANCLFLEVKPLYWLFGCLFFTVLSIHTSVVCNVKSRDELLCCLFILLSLWSTFKYLTKHKIFYVFLIFLFSLLAAWSKPTNIVYLLIIIPVIFYYQPKPFTKNLAAIVCFILGGVIAKLISFQLVELGKSPRPFIQFPLDSTSLIERIPTAIYSVGKYLELVFFPLKLSFYYGFNQVPITWGESFTHPIFYLGLLAVFLTPVLIFILFKNHKNISLGLLILCLGCLFFSNLIKPGPGLIAERYFFGPSIGICFLIAGIFNLLESYYKSKKKLIFRVALTLFGLCFIYQTQKTYFRNFAWKDKITLFKTDIKHLQKSAKANMLYADEMMFLNRKNNNQKYKFKNIEKHYLQAIKVYPDYWKSYNNYAFACLYFGYDDKAKGYIDKTLALKRSDKSLFNLSVYHQKKGNVSEELAILKEIINQNQANSTSLSAYTRLHNISIEQNQYKEGLKYANRAVKLIPDNSNMYDHIAKCHFALKDYDKAFENWKQALQKNPKSKVITYKLYKAYEQVNMLDSAELYRKKFELNQ